VVDQALPGNSVRLSALGKQHLHRYLAEFDFRYNNRSALVLRMWKGPKKRFAVSSGSA
jgi:hypothetical protein